MKDIVESLAGLGGLGQVELALITLVILVPAFRWTVRVLQGVVADEQMPLRIWVRCLILVVAIVFAIAIMLAVVVAMYGLVR